MPKFLYVYHGGSKPSTPEEGEKVMAKWMEWIGGNQSSFTDPGNPVGMSKTVSSGKIDDNGGSNPASGYGIVDVADMNAALELAKGCPIHDSGGSVEVAEIMEM
ncbi:MAG: hypothetical protein KJN99_03805 [Marinicaulis sp.]|nr:hypothetical protein [Marinicaulis sp.]